MGRRSSPAPQRHFGCGPSRVQGCCRGCHKKTEKKQTMAFKELFLWCVVLVWVSGPAEALDRQPDVQMYSRYPMSVGKENVLHCFAEGFHPPKINVTLLKNNVELPNVKQSDLSFKEDWTFQLLTYASVVPNGKDEYTCKVEHQALQAPKIVKWGQDY